MRVKANECKYIVGDIFGAMVMNSYDQWASESAGDQTFHKGQIYTVKNILYKKWTLQCDSLTSVQHITTGLDKLPQFREDTDEDFYVLSRYPFANCLFCGGAGPETVVDLQFDGPSPREYATDERLTFAGKLKLNSDDIYQMNYIIKGAREHTP